MQEYIKSYKYFPEVNGRRSPCDSLYGDDSQQSVERSSPPVVHRISDSSMDLVSGDARHVVQSLAEHVVYCE